MKRYFVCVYAISKNESVFVERWMQSMSEADAVVVLDTGSTDDTVEKLRERGATVVQEEIKPWRFDTARNRSMELIPEYADICICTDLDEVFRPGWRKYLEEAWEKGAGQATYRYTWSFRPDGSEDVVFWYEKCHARQGYQWVHPVHEILQWTGEGKPGPMVVADGVQLDHHPDPGKSRAQYLELLELSVQEEPEDDRNMHYLGREYMFRERWDDCIRTLKKHLAMPNATWADERSASMRYIAKSYRMKGEKKQAQSWYLRAVGEAPHLREPWLEFALLLYELEDWDGVAYCTGRALQIKKRPRTYISEGENWGSLPHDLRCIALYKTGRRQEALEQAEHALRLEPGNARLNNNVMIIKESLKE